jgi:hypothetical protein
MTRGRVRAPSVVSAVPEGREAAGAPAGEVVPEVRAVPAAEAGPGDAEALAADPGVSTWFFSMLRSHSL